MGISEVKKIFDRIASVSAKTSKEVIIKQNKDNELFIECLKFLLDSDVVTGLSTKKMNKKVKLVDNEIESLIDAFKYIRRYNTGTDKNIAVIKSFCIAQGECREFCEQLFTKSIRLGIDAKTVNKAIPGLIPTFNVMLAGSYDKEKNKIKDGTKFILSTKLDGSRIIAIKEDDKITFKTRQSKLYEQLIDIEEDFKDLPNGVYDGELLAMGDFENSAEQYKETMKRSRKKGVKHGLKMVCYDYIENVNDFYNGLCKTECINRKNKLKQILSMNKEYVKYLEPLYIGGDKDKISEFFNMAIQNGEEGIMLSIVDAPYECKRSKNLLKVKEFINIDCLVVGVFKGQGKFKDTLGGLVCEFKYKNMICRTELGSGFKEHERKMIYDNPQLVMNKVITIKAFEISQNSKTGEYSCRFPVWLGMDYIRDDKDGINDTNVG